MPRRGETPEWKEGFRAWKEEQEALTKAEEEANKPRRSGRKKQRVDYREVEEDGTPVNKEMPNPPSASSSASEDESGKDLSVKSIQEEEISILAKCLKGMKKAQQIAEQDKQQKEEELAKRQAVKDVLTKFEALIEEPSSSGGTAASSTNEAQKGQRDNRNYDDA